jgi:arylsulfatase A
MKSFITKYKKQFFFSFLKGFSCVSVILFFLNLTACHKTDLLPNPPENPNDTNPPVFKDSRLNVILILADDVGYEIPTYTGGESYETPNLDFLAANGTQFSQCYSSALCSPSRFMLLTGKYNFRNYTDWGIMDRSQRTFANIFKLADYNTCAAGKWQFDGGDTSVHLFGFDKYMLNNAYNLHGDNEEADKFYKDPQIYTEGKYLPASETKGKYGQDMFRDYVFNFIDSNANKNPFFIYWALDLCHPPLSPTPDDPEFASWNPSSPRQASDTLFFPSMVKYMDKYIGQLVAKLKDDGIEGNTIVMFTGDNGTTNYIHSKFNGEVLPGGKATTLNLGTHVPFVAYCPGVVPAGRTDTTLVSFVDFMKTFADIANVSIPASYGINDGVSFAPQLKGQQYNIRDWVFNHYPGAGKFAGDPQHLRRWMQNAVYKQYDTMQNSKSGKFYNLVTDPFEQHPLSPKKLSPEEKAYSDYFFGQMGKLH